MSSIGGWRTGETEMGGVCVCVRQTMKNEQAICLINFLNITIALVSTASRDPAFAGRSEAGNVFEFELDLMSWAIRRRRVERSRRAAGNLWSALEFLLIDVAPKKQDSEWKDDLDKRVAVMAAYLRRQPINAYYRRKARLRRLGLLNLKRGKWLNSNAFNYVAKWQFPHLRWMDRLAEMRWLGVIRHR